jgi:choline dehydrogenase-like flavoprotein
MNAQGKAEGVHYIERTTHARREARAKIVVLAASALESTRILLNSRSSRFPQGLGNSSGQLGHYLMDHFTLEGAGGFLPQFKSSQREPRGTPCGFLIPKYVNTGQHVNRSFLRGYRFDGDGSQELYAHAFGLAGFGSDWRRKVRTEIPYYFGMTVQGECLPRYDNYVTLDAGKKDAWGIPALHIVASYGENERTMAKSMRNDVMEILGAMKVEDAQPPGESISVFGKNIHECGTARMGSDPEKSVVNGFCQLHDAKNVFVTDGAVFVTQGCYEPTLTIMAISARAGDYIADEYRKGDL